MKWLPVSSHDLYVSCLLKHRPSNLSYDDGTSFLTAPYYLSNPHNYIFKLSVGLHWTRSPSRNTEKVARWVAQTLRGQKRPNIWPTCEQAGVPGRVHHWVGKSASCCSQHHASGKFSHSANSLCVLANGNSEAHEDDSIPLTSPIQTASGQMVDSLFVFRGLRTHPVRQQVKHFGAQMRRHLIQATGLPPRKANDREEGMSWKELCDSRDKGNKFCSYPNVLDLKNDFVIFALGRTFCPCPQLHLWVP